MKHTLLSSLFFVCVGLSACTPKHYAPVGSGIEFRLSSPSEEAPPLRPEGMFHVQALDRRLSLYVPVAALTLGKPSKRLPLPPGSYAVEYSPMEPLALASSTGPGAITNVLSPNPFLVVVAKDRFTTVRVETLDAAASARLSRAEEPAAARR